MSLMQDHSARDPGFELSSSEFKACLLLEYAVPSQGSGSDAVGVRGKKSSKLGGDPGLGAPR